ncbi:uncharacterized protein LAJ45_05942 [Morchella importuna]|nr:uncharacterized protein LAJ45_05942 [Morchella importuna]KAH8149790.1 hypothetical protein LAJ45_05942 [Morchella importuna]
MGRTLVEIGFDGFEAKEKTTWIHNKGVRDVLEEHLDRFPPFDRHIRSRLFSYGPDLEHDQKLVLSKSFDFHGFGNFPKIFDHLKSGSTIDYETVFRRHNWRVLLDVTLGYFVQEPTKADYDDEVTSGAESGSKTIKPLKREFSFAGDKIHFPGSGEFEMALINLRMVCYQDSQGVGRLETFRFGPAKQPEVHQTPMAYVMSEVKLLDTNWNEIIRKCRRILSGLNRGVLEDDKFQDRKLVRKMVKYAKTFEQLHRVYQQQSEALHDMISNFSENEICPPTLTEQQHPQQPRKKLKQIKDMEKILFKFDKIGKTIEDQLLRETRDLIERTHNIISIDEAYRSRDMNESVKRLSWITFIFLPLLFVASLFGMNINILENNPGWFYYLEIAIPMFFSIMVAVAFLKHWKSLRDPQTWRNFLITRKKVNKMIAPVMAVRKSIFVREKAYDLEQGFTNGRDEQLIAAIDAGDGERVKELLTRPKQNTNMPVRALVRGHCEGAERFIEHRDSTTASTTGRTPLQAAAASGSVGTVTRLLERKQDVNAPPANNEGRTALQAAAEKGHLNVVVLLIQYRANVNAAAGMVGGRTALQGAAGGGHLEIVETLLKFGAECNIAPAEFNGRTALQAAAENGWVDIARKLVDSGARVNAAPGKHGGRTAIQAAAEGGNLEMFKQLLRIEADFNAAPAHTNGRTALQAAAGRGHLEIVNILLNHEVDCNEDPAPVDGRTSLQASAEGGYLNVVQLLLESGADPNAAPSQGEGCTALQGAARNGHEEIVRLLINYKAKVTEEEGSAALQAAASGGHHEIVEILISNQAPINYLGHGNVLQAAAHEGHQHVVELLISKGADITATSSAIGGVNTAFMAAIEKGHYGIVKLLMEKSANSYDLPDALLLAAMKKQEDIISLLIKQGDDIDQIGVNGRTALQMAAGKAQKETMQILIQKGAKVNALAAPEGGRTAIQAAAEGGHNEIIEFLIKEGATISVANDLPANNGGRTTLQAAVEGGNIGTIELLISKKAEINAAPAPRNGRTALQIAAGSGKTRLMMQLINEGADVNAASAIVNGRTALQAAAEGGYKATVELLIREGAEINEVPSANNGRTANGANVHAAPADERGFTALQIAAKCGDQKLVKLLIEKKANVNAAPAAYGLTALQASAIEGHLTIVQLLLEKGADINAAPAAKGGLTALQAAVKGGHMGIIQLLIDKGAAINAAPAETGGRTALQIASEKGNMEIFHFLLENKADVDAMPATYDGQTALTAGVEGGHMGIVKILLHMGANVNTPSTIDRHTALQIAKERGFADIAQLLIEKGALDTIPITVDENPAKEGFEEVENPPTMQIERGQLLPGGAPDGRRHRIGMRVKMGMKREKSTGTSGDLQGEPEALTQQKRASTSGSALGIKPEMPVPDDGRGHRGIKWGTYEANSCTIVNITKPRA